MQQEYEREMVMLYGAPFADAHNEFLQFLLTIGITGTAAYFGLLFSTLALSLKKLGKNPKLLPFLLILASVLFQGIVNNAQIFTTPVFFVFLGITGALLRNLK